MRNKLRVIRIEKRREQHENKNNDNNKNNNKKAYQARSKINVKQADIIKQRTETKEE